MIIVFAFAPFGFLFIWMMFFAGQGMTCSNCQSPLPRFQSPLGKSQRQWWEGGSICRTCGCDCDARGFVVAAGRSVSPATKRKMLGYLVAAVIPALVLLAVIGGLIPTRG